MHCGPIWHRNRKLRGKDSNNTLYSQENVIYHSKNYIPLAIDNISRDEDSANEKKEKIIGTNYQPY